MAPRPLESREAFVERLRKREPPLRFGGQHDTHAVVVENGLWRVRRLVLGLEKAEAYRREHGVFTPEAHDRLSEPGPDVVLEATSREQLIVAFQHAPWPWS